MSASAGPARLDDGDVVLLRLLAEGRTMPEVARRLCVSERTVRRRVRTLCDGFGVGSAIEAVVHAVRNDLI